MRTSAEARAQAEAEGRAQAGCGDAGKRKRHDDGQLQFLNADNRLVGLCRTFRFDCGAVTRRYFVVHPAFCSVPSNKESSLMAQKVKITSLMIWMGDPRTKLSGLALTASATKSTCRQPMLQNCGLRERLGALHRGLARRSNAYSAAEAPAIRAWATDTVTRSANAAGCSRTSSRPTRLPTPKAGRPARAASAEPRAWWFAWGRLGRPPRRPARHTRFRTSFSLRRTSPTGAQFVRSIKVRRS